MYILSFLDFHFIELFCGVAHRYWVSITTWLSNVLSFL